MFLVTCAVANVSISTKSSSCARIILALEPLFVEIDTFATAHVTKKHKNAMSNKRVLGGT